MSTCSKCSNNIECMQLDVFYAFSYRPTIIKNIREYMYWQVAYRIAHVSSCYGTDQFEISMVECRRLLSVYLRAPWNRRVSLTSWINPIYLCISKLEIVSGNNLFVAFHWNESAANKNVDERSELNVHTTRLPARRSMSVMDSLVPTFFKGIADYSCAWQYSTLRQ
jgi:hypothetical protein